jgi:glutaconate CoA-transferase, subunit B
VSEYALGELLAVVLSRRLRNGELGIIGTASPIQVAACSLAQRRGRWVSWLSGPLGVLDPRMDHLLPTADERLIPTASALLDLTVMIDCIDWKKHFFDFAILGAMQVDRFGNLNTVCIGPHARPLVRGPGTIGTSPLAGLSRRFMVLLTQHEPSILVERVDFCSAVGHHKGGRTRETELGLPPGGPDLVLTPLGCFDFHPESRAMRVESLHQGVTLETVRARTGFELIVEGRPRVTPPPDDEELETLRMSVDSEGVLRK